MITLYVKAIVKPFLFDMTPAQAHEMILTELPHKAASRALTTKGVLNLFSDKTQKFMRHNMIEDDNQLTSANSHTTNDDSDPHEMEMTVRPGPQPT